MAALFAASAGTAATDPALDALRDRDAYVSPRVAGVGALQEERELAAAAARLNDARRPVKLAVVAGPVGSPSMPVYVRRLKAQLGYDGTLVVTTRGRTIAAAGPRATADMTRALRAERVGRIADPVARLTRAADVAAPPPTDLEAAGRKSALVLILIAVLGGAWATALGVGARGRRTRREITEARGRARVCADALRAHTMVLARRPDLPPDARRHVEHALGVYADAVSSLPEMRSAEEVAAFGPRLRGALDEIAGVTASVTGVPAPADPFTGLCGIDPAHGAPVTAPGEVGPRALCEACRDAMQAGEPPVPRMLFEDGGPVPFDAARYGPALRPDETP
jgi:hypothetical protein